MVNNEHISFDIVMKMENILVDELSKSINSDIIKTLFGLGLTRSEKIKKIIDSI